jgi:hypothetical protein
MSHVRPKFSLPASYTTHIFSLGLQQQCCFKETQYEAIQLSPQLIKHIHTVPKYKHIHTVPKYKHIYTVPKYKHIHTVPKYKAQETAFQVLNINTNTSISMCKNIRYLYEGK